MANLPAKQHWLAEDLIEPPTHDGADLSVGGETLDVDEASIEEIIRPWLDDLLRFGLARLTNLPLDPHLVEHLIARMGAIRDTNFGLTAGIVTTNLARATHFRRNARTGVVTVNLPTAGTDYHVPFGGRGNSSYGPREQGSYAAEFYTTVKTAYIAAGTPEELA